MGLCLLYLGHSRDTTGDEIPGGGAGDSYMSTLILYNPTYYCLQGD